MSILDQIVATKREEVSSSVRRRSLTSLREEAESAESARDFAAKVCTTVARGRPAVIAEIKKASPSKGVLRERFSPVELAKAYAENGAKCLSVLTDKPYFQGSPDDLRQAKAACALPVLRKDFIVDVYQIYESRCMGADAILLIAACLDDAQMSNFEALAVELGMSVLVEAHDAPELDRALRLHTPLIGINNRNLKTFEVSLATTLTLKRRVPDGRCVVGESGIHTVEDVRQLQSEGVHAFLVGETLVRNQAPGLALAALLR